MKTFKRVLSVFLVFLMLFSLILSTGLTASATIYSGECGPNLTWTLDTSTGALDVFGTGDMTDYSDEGAPWYSYRNSIKNVTIGDSVTGIGSYAFYNCKYLRNVNVPASVTSIGERAFYLCSSVTGVYITDMASWCGISFEFGSNPLISISKLYLNDKVVTDLVIPDSVTSIGAYAFYKYAGMTSVSIPASVTSIGFDAFNDCTSLTGVYITDMAAWCGISFEFGSNPLECAKKLYLNGELVTDLVIPDSVTSIGNYVFCNSDSLTSVSIGDSVVSIGYDAFGECPSLKSVSISASVENISSYAFSESYSLTEITVDENNQYYSSDEYGIFYDKNKTLLIQCPAANSISDFVVPDSVKIIGKNAFDYCISLVSIDIPDSVTSIGEEAFYGCKSLSSISIGDSVTDIGRHAFKTTSYYKDTANWKNDILYIGKHLIEAYHPYDDFPSSYSIKEGTLTIADYAFEDLVNFTKVDIPESVKSIGKNAFAYCMSLVSIDIPDSVASIGAETFYCCSSLSNVSFGDSLTSIGDYAFAACSSLKNVVLPQSVVSIGNEAFLGCISLENVVLPRSVTSIGENAFHDYVYDTKEYEVLNTTIKCFENSYAYDYAVNNGISYTLLNSIVTEKGMQFKIDNLESVKSIRYAYGDYDTEKDIKYGADSVSHSAKNLRKRGDSCVLQFLKPGLVSIVVTYNDGSRDFYKYDVIKSEPTVTRDGGNSITFENLDDLKVLRYVKGEYESSYDIKRASGSVAISGKALNSDTYTVALDRETYTFCVQYNDESYNYYVTGICGDNLTWVYDMQSATLTISGEGEMEEYDYKKYPWSSYSNVTEKLIVDEGIINISQSAFNGFEKLVDISLPSTLEIINESAFSYCSSIVTVVLSDNLRIIESGAFADCKSLESIDLGNGLTEVGNFAFHLCKSLKELHFPETISFLGTQMCLDCSSLDVITLPDKPIYIEEWAFLGTSYFKNPYNSKNIENGLYYIGNHLINSVKNPNEYYEVRHGTISIANAAIDFPGNVLIPESVLCIGKFALVHPNLNTIACYENSYAHKYALENGYTFNFIK